MGIINIEMKGSFGTTKKHQESAMFGGHAAAIGRAIEFLVGQLPEAIENDHRNHDAGSRPPHADFGKSGHE